MEDYIQISKINDFLYSPASLYLHSTYEDFSGKIYKQTAQIKGELNHKNIDDKKYSSKKSIMSGEFVYSEKYKVMGKIDIYDKDNGYLIERKTKIKKMYQGYIYQLYAQFFCLKEMGEGVKKMFLHSLEDNKRYYIDIPNNNEEREFLRLIEKIRKFNPKDLLNKKCDNFSKISIYEPLSW